MIKAALIVAVLVLLAWAFRNRRRTAMRAGVRILSLLVAVFALTSIADPAITTAMARWVGVGRGTDLLLYVSVVTFGVATVGLYFRSRQLEQRLNTLTRTFAIRTAIAERGAPGPPASNHAPTAASPLNGT